ncbi:hypothetical protein [Caulobacter hibisci]|uniref:Uncharacterized protein n=1 Tax=Caulobacter hibisci TaxID=2035993 RepID=A0ABS0SSL9_9CAUL|nr:hypothetical protein [Caulobacter hibisci]MBI1682341.1 hypothetical protein [Caulobacter hibisci]
MQALVSLCVGLARSTDDLTAWGKANAAALQSHPETLPANRAAYAARMAELQQGAAS